MWIAEKFQSNPEIAGSPRNSFRASLEVKRYGGRALNDLGAFTGYRSLSNSEYRYLILRSQTVCDKIHSQKGNSPDPQLRSQIHAKWKTMWSCENNQDVGLEAATH